MISAWQTLQEDDFGPHMEPAAVVVEESTPPPPLWMINQEGQHCPLLIEIARLSSLLIYFSHSLVVF
jgi:hypothetical protein